MEPYYYRISIRKSIEEDNADIVAGFKEILKRGLKVQLKLVNYYKGLPISYPATLVEVNGDVVELDVHPQQAVALQSTGRTCVKCSHFHLPLLAEVKDADVRRMMASLSRFSFVDIMAEQRASLRLELDPPCDAEIRVAADPLAGKVLDVSLGGFSIRTSRPCPLSKGDEARVKLIVPNLVQNSVMPLEVTATLVGTSQDQEGEILRFSTPADPYAESVLSRFIFQRQVDLIREIKEQS